MGRTACTDPQCLYKGALLHLITHDPQGNTQEILFEQNKINISVGLQLLGVTEYVWVEGSNLLLSVVL